MDAPTAADHDGEVAVGEATVAYRVAGRGEPAVLVHSTGGSRIQWLLAGPPVAERHRTVIPELSGAGLTVDGGGPLHIDELVAQVLAVTDHLGIERFHLGGYSLGAAVAAATAAEAGDRVASLALLFGWARSDEVLALQFDLWARLFRSDRSLFARYLLSVASSEDYLRTVGAGIEQVIELFAAGLAPGTDRHAGLDARLDISDRLAAIRAPTLVAGGRHDRVLPIEHSRHLADAIPGATLRELDGNHLLFHEDPSLVGELLVDWFRRHPLS